MTVVLGSVMTLTGIPSAAALPFVENRTPQISQTTPGSFENDDSQSLTLLFQKDSQSALEAYTQTINQEPNNPTLYYPRGYSE